MIHDAAGNTVDIITSPLGVITRGNPAQLFEAALGKIAQQTGRPYKMPSFIENDLVDFTKQELSKHGLKDTEDLYDPTTGKKIPKIFTGNRFFMKLHHMAETKGSGRGLGSYTSEGVPAKGPEGKSKRVALMENNALLSHGATAVMRDVHLVRGQRNDDYWRMFKMGYAPPSPKTPLIYEKLLASLQASGINVKRDPNTLQIMALTDTDIKTLSGGEITSSDTVDFNSMSPAKGGLFDQGITGGMGGNRWGHINLVEPMPSPVMEDPIRRLLGLTKVQFDAVISGERPLNGRTGGTAIKEALRRIRIDNEIDTQKSIIKSGANSKRDGAVKALSYLKMFKRTGLKPENMVLSMVPVLPPVFRPVTKMKDTQLVSDANFLYQDLININDDMKELRNELPADMLGEERLRLYRAFKAVTGLGDPINPKYKEKRVKGLLAQIFGKSPKTGLFQRRTIGASADTVGRAVITPNPELDMDHVGLPEDKAWTIYEPFITRDMVRRGAKSLDAARHVANRTNQAREALLRVMAQRPVIINRAPTMHKFGMMASWPVLVKGNTMQISPVVAAGFGADYDGDAMNYHVPVSDDAVAETIDKMMPSRNLLSLSRFKVHYVPRLEFLQGLYTASTSKSKQASRVFRSKEDVIKAYKRGDIRVDDKVVIGS